MLLASRLGSSTLLLRGERNDVDLLRVPRFKGRKNVTKEEEEKKERETRRPGL